MRFGIDDGSRCGVGTIGRRIVTTDGATGSAMLRTNWTSEIWRRGRRSSSARWAKRESSGSGHSELYRL
jgi:K+-transporting ATPase c subunit